MEFSSFTFIVTEECNFKCSYCYQKKGKKYIDVSTIEKALDFFFPFLTEECCINFYGGEPLLAFEKIRGAVSYIQDKNRKLKKQVQYSIAINGSLINDDILHFLNQYKFSLLLSFDGFAQDISRKRGSFRQIVSIIEKLLKSPDIDLEINSVFTPATVGYLSKSIQFIIELGVPNIALSLSKISPWEHSSILQLKKELVSLKGFILSFYKRTASIPLVNFRRNSRKGIFVCFPGQNHMTLIPDSILWGCNLFPDYFKGKEGTREYLKYCFGDLDTFIENYERIYPEILSNFSNLRMDYYYTSDTFCMQCDELKECEVCPMDAAFSSSIIGKIPVWTCEIKKIFRKEKKLFWKELESKK